MYNKKNQIARHSDSTKITEEYFDSLLVEMRHIGAEPPNTQIKLFGESFSFPIMPAALSHLNSVREGGMTLVAKAAHVLAIPMWAGMGTEKELGEIIDTGAKTIKIIKPYADNSTILKKIKHAENSGALAVGIDIDHAFNRKGEFDVIHGHKMSSKTAKELEQFIKISNLPFIVKGVLSEYDAKLCLEIGAQGIVVSHHHGLLDYAVPPLMILPSIVNIINKKIPIFVDCGVRTGMDAFKALALGASGVGVGKEIISPLKEKGEEGVQETFKKMAEQLRHAMCLTASGDVNNIDKTIIHHKTFF